MVVTEWKWRILSVMGKFKFTHEWEYLIYKISMLITITT